MKELFKVKYKCNGREVLLPVMHYRLSSARAGWTPQERAKMEATATFGPPTSAREIEPYISEDGKTLYEFGREYPTGKAFIFVDDGFIRVYVRD